MSAAAKCMAEHAALTPVTLAGEAFLLDPAGVALHPESGSLVVADLHLEKAAHFAAYGQMLPPYETRDTLRRLITLVEAHGPRRIICLGIVFTIRTAAYRQMLRRSLQSLRRGGS